MVIITFTFSLEILLFNYVSSSMITLYDIILGFTTCNYMLRWSSHMQINCGRAEAPLLLGPAVVGSRCLNAIFFILKLINIIIII